MVLCDTQVDAVMALARQYQVSRLIVLEEPASWRTSLQGVVMACAGCSGWSVYAFAAELEQLLGQSVVLVPLTAENRYSQLLERRGRRLL